MKQLEYQQKILSFFSFKGCTYHKFSMFSMTYLMMAATKDNFSR